MDAKNFIRDCYLLSEPSIDLDKVNCGEVDCTKHRLATSTYEMLLEKYTKTDDERLACNLWCLNQGPALYDDKKEDKK